MSCRALRGMDARSAFPRLRAPLALLPLTPGSRSATDHRVPPQSEPLPVETVRDLLAIVRVLYRGERSAERRAELVEIGLAYRRALRLAKAGPETLGGRAAWTWAEQATERLGRLVDYSTPIGPGIFATAARIRR
jgi:hypothetical protein